MNNIKTYNIPTINPEIPSVSYFQSSGDIEYKREMKFTNNKNLAEPGDLVLSNGNEVWFCSLDYFIANGGYPNTPDYNEVYPTGVVVVPASHTTDGSVRICSLKYMDYTNREGSDKPVGIYWGAYNYDIQDLTDYDDSTLQTYIPGTTTVSTGEYGMLATNYHKNRNEVNIDDPGTYWSQFRRLDEMGYYPSPYNRDGSKSSIYHAEDTLLSDMNGKTNTSIMADFSENGYGYDLDDLKNIYDQEYTPAALACMSYSPKWNGESTYFDYGEYDDFDRSWYLPSIGELGYLVARMEVIDRVRRYFGAAPLWNIYLWSSTECSQNNAWRLRLYEGYFGYVNANAKRGSYLSVIAFASF